MAQEMNVRQNYSSECEAALNKQINMELHASYAYRALFAYFDRSNVGLGNVAKFFQRMAHEEVDHAEIMIKYQNLRGGIVVFQNVEKPVLTEVKTIVESFEAALQYEKDVNMVSSNILIHNRHLQYWAKKKLSYHRNMTFH